MRGDWVGQRNKKTIPRTKRLKSRLRAGGRRAFRPRRGQRKRPAAAEEERFCRPQQKEKAKSANARRAARPRDLRRGAHCGGAFYGIDAFGLYRPFGRDCFGLFVGLSGAFNYVLPFVFIGQGVYAIFTSGKQAAVPRLMLLCAVSLCILSFLHVFFADRIQAEGYFAFLWESFSFGEAARAGGGLLGALFCYPAVQLLGKAGSFVLFPALALIARGGAYQPFAAEDRRKGRPRHQAERRCRYQHGQRAPRTAAGRAPAGRGDPPPLRCGRTGM